MIISVLCGQLLCFFKDTEDFSSSKAATAPITIFNAICEKADDYTKKKNVFRLKCTDGSEFLFLAPSQEEMEDWVNKISFHAKLPPSLQLLSYDESQKVCNIITILIFGKYYINKSRLQTINKYISRLKYYYQVLILYYVQILYI